MFFFWGYKNTIYGRRTMDIVVLSMSGKADVPEIERRRQQGRNE